MIARDPDIARSGSGTSVFDDWPRRRDPDVDLCIRGSDGKKYTQNRY
jgi:hypothetical protein